MAGVAQGTADDSKFNSAMPPGVIEVAKARRVEVSRETLMAFYDGIGVASEATQQLREGKLPPRGKSLRTLGYCSRPLTSADETELVGKREPVDAQASTEADAGKTTGGLRRYTGRLMAERVRSQDLFTAAVKGDEEMVRLHLQSGDPADSRPGRHPNETPLMAAAMHGHLSLVCISRERCVAYHVTLGSHPAPIVMP